MRLITILILFSLTVHGQTESQRLQTMKYAGTFSYAKDKNGATGTILIYPESDSTILFYIEINRGAPSYNMGSLYGRLKIIKGQGLTYLMTKGANGQFNFQMTNSRLGL